MTRTRTSLAVLITSATAVIGLLGTASTAGAEPVPAGSSETTTTSAPTGSSESSTGSVPDPAATSSSTSPSAPGSTSVAKRAVTPGPACTTNADALYPVVCLPEGSGEDETGQVVLGGTIDFGAQIVNNGPAVAGAKLVITLPPQLRLSDDEGVVRYDDWYDDDSDEDGTDLTCTASADGSTVTCETGPLAANVNTLADITLDVTEAAQAGTTASFTTALQPETEGAFPTTSVSATVAFLLPSRLTVSITPGKADVVLGRKKDLTVRVRNVGTGASPDTFAVSLLLPEAKDDDESGDFTSHFTITNAPDVGLPGLGDTPSPAVAGTSSSLAHTTRFVAGAKPTQFAFWPIGTIAPGATASFVITVQAETLGTDSLLVSALSPTEADVECDDSGDSGDSDSSLAPSAPADDPADDPACTDSTTASLTAIAAPATASSSGHAPAGSGDQVANTGVNDLTPQLLLGVLALLMGAALTLAGRRRVRGRHTA